MARRAKPLTASYQYRHGPTVPFYFQSNSGYYRDVIKDLDHEANRTQQRWALTLGLDF